MERGLVAVGTELFDLQPFGGVPAVLFRRVARHAGGTLGGIGPAFGALESDHDPDALVLGHKGRCAAGAKRIDKHRAYPLTRQALSSSPRGTS